MAIRKPIEDKEAISQAIDFALKGELIAFPTDTVYGVGSIVEPQAVSKIYRAKERPLDKPIPILLSDDSYLEKYAKDIDAIAMELARTFWPGALTLVVRAKEDVAEAVGSKDGTVGFRIPDYEPAREIIRQCGGAMAVTSANISGERNPLTADDVEHDLGDRVAIILDGGPCRIGKPSTVVDLSKEKPLIVREGALAEQIRAILEK